MPAQLSRLFLTVPPARLSRAIMSLSAQRLPMVAASRGLMKPAAARRLPPLAAPHTRLHVRCLASKGGGDKSWADIAAEAAQLGTELVKKVGSTVGQAASRAVEALVPSDEERQRVERRDGERRRREDVYRPGAARPVQSRATDCKHGCARTNNQPTAPACRDH